MVSVPLLYFWPSVLFYAYTPRFVLYRWLHDIIVGMEFILPTWNTHLYEAKSVRLCFRGTQLQCAACSAGLLNAMQSDRTIHPLGKLYVTNWGIPSTGRRLHYHNRFFLSCFFFLYTSEYCALMLVCDVRCHACAMQQNLLSLYRSGHSPKLHHKR